MKNSNWTNEIGNSYGTLLPTSTLALWSIALLLINLLCLFTSVLSIIVIEHGVIMKFQEDTLKKTSGFIVHTNLEPNINPIDRPPTQKS
jgi:hypothetical protein